MANKTGAPMYAMPTNARNTIERRAVKIPWGSWRPRFEELLVEDQRQPNLQIIRWIVENTAYDNDGVYIFLD